MTPTDKTGRLFLVPVGLGAPDPMEVIPAANITAIAHIRDFIAENERSARRFLVKAGFPTPIDDLKFSILDKRTPRTELLELLQPALAGRDMALLSEAGTPCIADPGQALVRLAHQKGVQLRPLTGPNSILLALMASGFNGQQFVFHGYLPIDRQPRQSKIRQMEDLAIRTGQTQIFMETPYRNNGLMEELVRSCRPTTMLCIALDLTMETESIQSMPIARWQKKMPNLNKRPGIFLIHGPQ